MDKTKLLAMAAIRFGIVQLEDQSIRVREVGTTEYAEYGRLNNGEKDDKGVVTVKGDRMKALAYLVSVCVVDDDGAAVYDIKEAESIAASPRIVLPIFNKVIELSGLKEGAEKHPVAD